MIDRGGAYLTINGVPWCECDEERQRAWDAPVWVHSLRRCWHPTPEQAQLAVEQLAFYVDGKLEVVAGECPFSEGGQ